MESRRKEYDEKATTCEENPTKMDLGKSEVKINRMKCVKGVPAQRKV